MENRTLIKHRWEWGPFGRFNNNKYGLYCRSCGQFCHDGDERKSLQEYFDKTDCPRFIDREGNFMIQLNGQPKYDIWDDYCHCLNIRQAIEFGRNRWKTFDVRIMDLEDRSWIEI